MLSENEIKNLEDLAKENRQNVIKMVHNAKSGHIGGSLSATDIMTVLFHKNMKTVKDKTSAEYKNRDRFVLSKGHISPLYYSVLAQLGYFPQKDLMTFRKLGSKLQGHPTIACNGVEVCTGSLGQGLSIACGIAISLKLDKNPANVFVLTGDGELQEGNFWEGLMQANQRNLNNLTLIIDRNRLQIDGCTENIKALDNLNVKISSFGWEIFEINGHNISEIYTTIEKAKKSSKPAAIIANTIKGKGVSFMENNAGWHGKAPDDEDFKKAIKELE